MSNKRKRYIPRRSETELENDENDSESDCCLQKTTYKIKKEIIPTEMPIDTGERLGETFFNTTCEELAKSLLGKILVRHLDQGSILKGRIVETECYLGGEDKASHSYQGKVTARNKAMFMKPGTIYIYLTYGMYALCNISSLGEGAAVLLRALEPLQGVEEMMKFRNNPRPDKPEKQTTKVFKPHELCNGPAKLCISFNIDRTLNKKDLAKSDELWIEDGYTVPEHKIVSSHRVGVESAGLEWASKLLRYYILDNKSVSKRDKRQEIKVKEIADYLQVYASSFQICMEGVQPTLSSSAFRLGARDNFASICSDVDTAINILNSKVALLHKKVALVQEIPLLKRYK